MQVRSSCEPSFLAAIGMARRDGWAVIQGARGDDAVLACPGYEPVPTRRTDPVLAALRPLERSSARPGSMSAKFGRGCLPLHTDGAYMAHPPEVVILSARQRSDVGTCLLDVRVGALPSKVETAARHGVFALRDGVTVRCCTARDPSGRFRYDPVIMMPRDALARSVARYLDRAMAAAVVHAWREGEIVVIDNTSVVHGRADAAPDPERELFRVMLRAL